MLDPTEKYRRLAKSLRKSFASGDEVSLQRAAKFLNEQGALTHAKALHIIATEAGHDSWPKMKSALENAALDRTGKQDRLKMALFHGQNWVVDQLLGDTPDLADGMFGLQCALYNVAAVKAKLAADPKAATREYGPRGAILHLTFSKYFQAHPEKSTDMIAVAELLLENGADVNDSYVQFQGSDAPLSAFYGAIGHANNMVLGQWLLDHGADASDGESLYHATELGHLDGLRMLLEHGAKPKGTNALLRALDFNNHAMVQLLLDHGADPNEFRHEKIDGENPFVIPALHQAARRHCDGKMAEMLLAAGADPNYRHEGASAYAMARVFNNPELAAALSAAGADTTLNNQEQILADAADGVDTIGHFVDPAKLPNEFRNILRSIVHMPNTFAHMRRLVAVGIEYDKPDDQGITPVQIAGWEGLPEVMKYFLKLKPDLSHVNGYGGTLLSTILHGSENMGDKPGRDHIECARLALAEGVALPRKVINFAGRPDIAAFLRDWANEKPGQVIEDADG